MASLRCNYVGVTLPFTEFEEKNFDAPEKRKDSPETHSLSEWNYLADRESNSDESYPTKYQDESHDMKRQKKERCDDFQQKSRKKHLREVQYDAKHVLSYIQAARGDSYVPPIIGRSTIFNGLIDLTSVKHVVSSKVGHNPDGPERNANGQNAESFMDIPELYSSLVEATRSFYPLVTAEEKESELSDNSSTETREGKKEGRFTGLSCSGSESYNGGIRHPLEISLDGALSLCQDPRMVIRARAPYSVVHVNAAFCRQFGTSGSQNFISRSLNQILSDEAGQDQTDQVSKYLEESLVDEDRRAKGMMVIAGSSGRKSKTFESPRCCMTLLGLVASDDESSKASSEQELSMKAYGHCVFGFKQMIEPSEMDSNSGGYISAMG